MESSMTIGETTEDMQARWQLIDGEGNVVEERVGYLGVGALLSKTEAGVDAMVSIGPCFTPSELIMATNVILYSVLKSFNQLGIMIEAEEMIKKVLEQANDLS